MSAARTRCPACDALIDPMTVVERENVPVLQNVIVPTRAEATVFPTHRLHYVCCPACAFIWNRAFEDDRIDYGGNYNNSVQSSGYYLDHQRAMARRVLDALPEGHTGYAEIGCGAGEFIENLLAVGGGRIDAVAGFDPAWTGQRDFDDRVTIHPKYFSLDDLDQLPATIGAVASRHTIEHVPSPRGFVDLLARACQAQSVDLFIETPDVTWILQNTAFEDWFYEHCSLFSPGCIDNLLAEFGMKAHTDPVYSGQYMWTHARPGPNSTRADSTGQFTDLVAAYRTRASALLDRWREDLVAMRADGPVAVWGAASKGVTFCLLMNQHEPLIDMAIDLNPAKQGCFMPVTGTAIVDPGKAKAAGVRTLIVMNPNYLDEIGRMAAGMDWSARVLNLRPET